jgi:23S rRNA (pseudouridine1915-N3)-methyltransferase
MRIRILAVGHRQPPWVEAAFEDYARRMPPEARIELVSIKPEPRPDPAGEAAIERLLEREALDERGRAVTTRDLAGWLERWLASGRDVGMVIGSADGLHPSVKAAADLTLSLSPLTLPHGLVRVLLAEQLYRGMSLLRGHPYHRD